MAAGDVVGVDVGVEEVGERDAGLGHAVGVDLGVGSSRRRRAYSSAGVKTAIWPSKIPLVYSQAAAFSVQRGDETGKGRYASSRSGDILHPRHDAKNIDGYRNENVL